MRFQSLLKIVSLLASIHASSADDALTISSIGCVAPSAFDSCLNAAVEDLTECNQEAEGNVDALTGCGIGNYMTQMQCYLESCWNKVYSCEYQNLVDGYQGARALVVPEDAPFWPAPDNAPGGCSCNLGEMYANQTGTLAAMNTCESMTGDAAALEECSCCGFGAVVATYYGICPTSDPIVVGLPDLLDAMTTYESNVGINCTDLIASVDCAAKWGFYSPDSGVYPDPMANLPPNGTEALSTTGGYLTSPPGGATYTWSLFSQTYTATAAPYDEKNVEATSSDDAAATSTNSGDTAAVPSKTSATAVTTSGSTKASSTKATSTAGSNESSTSSAAATSASKTSRAARVQGIASLDYTLFALLAVAAYIS